jgi:predicted alpha/beta-hydrolase family hydrolase
VSHLLSTVFVCAHGAGGHQDDGAMVRAARALEAAGFTVVRFNFPYREKGSRRPDPMPVLKQSISDVVTRVRAEHKPARLVIGGRSMGGRAASMLAAEGFNCDGLLLLAYPLHPAGQPEKLRDAHLAQIKVPVLCFNGTRDALCDQNLMKKSLNGLRWQMHWLEGADHSFRVLKSSGRTDAQVMDEVSRVAGEWRSRLAA